MVNYLKFYRLRRDEPLVCGLESLFLTPWNYDVPRMQIGEKCELSCRHRAAAFTLNYTGYASLIAEQRSNIPKNKPAVTARFD
jgi:hypothetical protein